MLRQRAQDLPGSAPAEIPELQGEVDTEDISLAQKLPLVHRHCKGVLRGQAEAS